MPTTKCPECEHDMNFDYSTRKMACKNCGLFTSRDELVNLRDKIRDKKELKYTDSIIMDSHHILKSGGIFICPIDYC